MKSLENANDKIHLICEQIKNETLEPAKLEASKIIESAHLEAKKIKAQAFIDAEKEILDAKVQIEKEKNIFHSSLNQAMKQGLESFKQEIINLFNQELTSLIEVESSKIDIIVKLTNAVVSALNNEGLNCDINLYVAKSLNLQEVAKALSKEVLQKLSHNPIKLGPFTGGAEIKLEAKRLTIDISDKALKEILASYLKRPEFRELIFKN